MSPDIIVVGAGIIGGSIAWRLSQAGLRVVLLDAGNMGGEASWAGAGMLAPGGEIERRSPWSDFALASARMYAGFVAELTSESGVAIDYRQTGAVEIAGDPAEWEALSQRAAAQRELGIRALPMSAAELREAVPPLGCRTAGALFFPDDALVDPRDVMRALRACCLRRGGQIREGTRVHAVELGAEGARVETAGGCATAGAVVLAAGAWSSQVAVTIDGAAGDLPPSLPVRGHLLGYPLAARSLGPILRRGQTYLLQRANGFTIAGTSVERVGFDRTLSAAVIDDIKARATELIPTLNSAGEPLPWLGFRPGTEDLAPRIGRFAGSSLWLAYGHYRNGILLAPATAQRVAREVTASWETDSPSTAGIAG
jgi:glycine oxidase